MADDPTTLVVRSLDHCQDCGWVEERQLQGHTAVIRKMCEAHR